MADATSSRPKWIPVYDERKFESSGKEHTTKWSTEIFADGPGEHDLLEIDHVHVTNDVTIQNTFHLFHSPIPNLLHTHTHTHTHTNGRILT